MVHHDGSYLDYIQYLLSYNKDLSRSVNTKRYNAYRSHVKQILEFESLKEEYPEDYSFDLGPNDFFDWTNEELGFLTVADWDYQSSTEYSRSSSESSLGFPQLIDQWNSTVEFHQSQNSGSARVRMLNSRLLEDSSSYDALNWDTYENPLGYPVHATRSSDGSLCSKQQSPVRNQGMCGSCWAIVAAAAVEASVVINNGVNVKVSPQELVDCDTQYNRGCSGGNPAMAFSYIQSYGIASAVSYPYIGVSHYQCLNRQRAVGISGTVHITSFDSSLLQYYVTNTGPVAVGVCASDYSFMFYQGGVYNNRKCCTSQNHAMLLVGYGTDSGDSGKDYWVLRNSWGKSWGENGYMRLLRYDGNDDDGRYTGGICGMDVNPTMPLGGFVQSDFDLDSWNECNQYSNSVYDWMMSAYDYSWQHPVTSILVFVAFLCGCFLLGRAFRCCKKAKCNDQTPMADNHMSLEPSEAGVSYQHANERRPLMNSTSTV